LLHASSDLDARVAISFRTLRLYLSNSSRLHPAADGFRQLASFT
jgi:hypothetical protein